MFHKRLIDFCAKRIVCRMTLKSNYKSGPVEKGGQGGQPPRPLCAERGGWGGQFEVGIPYDSTTILLLVLLFVSLEMSALNLR